MTTPSQRMGLLFTGAPAVPEMVSLAQQAEAAGYESLWMAETRLTRDAVAPAAAIAAATERIRIGTGIVNVYTRNPVLLAISFLSLNELAPGRMILGLGTGSPRVLAPQGIPFDKPLTRLREYCEVIPRLMRGESVTYHGHAVHLEEAAIEDVLSQDGDRLRAKMPLYLGVTGPKAMRYAGTVADGVLMNICLPTEYVSSRLELVEAGAREVGRSMDDIDVGMAILVCANDNAEVARHAARRFIGLYLGTMPNIAKETGVSDAVIESVTTALHSTGLEAAAQLVPDELVDRLAAAGTPDDCRRRIEEYRRAGVDLVVAAPLEDTLEESIQVFGPLALEPNS